MGYASGATSVSRVEFGGQDDSSKQQFLSMVRRQEGLVMFNSDEFYKQHPSLYTYLKSGINRQHYRRLRYSNNKESRGKACASAIRPVGFQKPEVCEDLKPVKTFGTD